MVPHCAICAEVDFSHIPRSVSTVPTVGYGNPHRPVRNFIREKRQHPYFVLHNTCSKCVDGQQPEHTGRYQLLTPSNWLYMVPISTIIRHLISRRTHCLRFICILRKKVFTLADTLNLKLNFETRFSCFTAVTPSSI